MPSPRRRPRVAVLVCCLAAVAAATTTLAAPTGTASGLVRGLAR